MPAEPRVTELIAALESADRSPEQEHVDILLGVKEADQLVAMCQYLGRLFRPDALRYRFGHYWRRILIEGRFGDAFMEAFGDTNFSALQSAARDRGMALRVRLDPPGLPPPTSEVDGALVQ